MRAKLRSALLAAAVLSLFPAAHAAGHRWKTGTVLSSEEKRIYKQVGEQAGEQAGRQPQANGAGAGGSAAAHEEWMYYTVLSGKKLYTARIEMVTGAATPEAGAGKPVKYFIEGTAFYFRNPDGSEVKAELIKTEDENSGSVAPR